MYTNSFAVVIQRMNIFDHFVGKNRKNLIQLLLDRLMPVLPKQIPIQLNRPMTFRYVWKKEKLEDSNQLIFKISRELLRPSQIKFVVDSMLHGLGRELRVAGCDAVILSNEDPHTDAIRVS
jgi:hypothetical protein